MKKLLVIFLIVLVVFVLMVVVASPANAQTEEPPTPTPSYVIVNTVSIGEYANVIAISALCLLMILFMIGASLWGFMQTRKRG